MTRIFSAVGGQGSHYLIGALRDRYTVGDKPDNALWHTLESADHSAPIPDQGKFAARSGGFEPPDTYGLLEVLPKYIEWLQQDPLRAVVFGLSAEFGLLSQFQVPGVIFLFRHPLHAYVSWAKPERHGSTIEHLGGLSSSDAVRYYALRWKRAAAEYLALRSAGLNPELIRYEVAAYDATPLGLRWAFTDFDSSKRNDGRLEDSAEQLLREIVITEFEQIYPDWEC